MVGNDVWAFKKWSYSDQVSKPKRDVWADEHLNEQSHSTGLRVSKQYIKLMKDDLEVSHRVTCMKYMCAVFRSDF